ncbi:M24 family metallopeptidase [Alteromonas lipolytica]|nr:M24 family metallopeptidase [Alteromonas lipolytica]GGF66858.1 Xaa-Pro aminopeptidase [Alteromonas lipolytica]
MRVLSGIILLCGLMGMSVQANPSSQLLSLKQRAVLQDSLLEKRISQLLPGLMTASGIDMWLMISREYNEDPVLKTFLPADWLQTARRTTMLVIVKDHNGKVHTLAVAPYKVGNLFERAWDKQQQPDQWQALNAIIETYQPATIGVNQSSVWAHADGLTVTDNENLMQALPPKYRSRVVSAEPLAVAWLETRIPEEITEYQKMVAVAHQIIAEGFSAQTITPGVTTTEDLVWWFRERVAELKLDTWFHPSVSVQRSDNLPLDHETTFDEDKATVILPGDLLHVDFGITYLGLNTDTQQHAYILKPGETKAPDYLQLALAKANQLQDIFTGEFAVGRTGNEVLAASLQKARDAGLKPTIYTHPLGFHGHAAGTTLGMWDQQNGVTGDGDYPLHKNTLYSIELNNAVMLDSWGKEIRVMLEEDAYFDGEKVAYLNGRQTRLIEIDASTSAVSRSSDSEEK